MPSFRLAAFPVTALAVATLAAMALAAASPAAGQTGRTMDDGAPQEEMRMETPGGILLAPMARQGLEAGEPAGAGAGDLARERDPAQRYGLGARRDLGGDNLASGALEKAEDLLGERVVSAAGRPVGDVEEVILGPSGQRRYLVVGTAGMPELGRSFVPVPEHRFRRIGEDSLQLLVAEELFLQAPRYNVADFAGTAERWPEEVDSWWRRNVEQAGPSE